VSCTGGLSHVRRLELTLCTLGLGRSIYRAIELLEGWSGPIIENQGLFDGLDGALMVSRRSGAGSQKGSSLWNEDRCS
jgi:hypothetical protein